MKPSSPHRGRAYFLDVSLSRTCFFIWGKVGLSATQSRWGKTWLSLACAGSGKWGGSVPVLNYIVVAVGMAILVGVQTHPQSPGRDRKVASQSCGQAGRSEDWRPATGKYQDRFGA